MKRRPPSAPEEVILEDAKNKLDLARKRLDDLSVMGVTADKLDQFQSQIAAYSALPVDATLLSIQKQLTASKDSVLKDAVAWGSMLRDRCKLAFGNTAHNPFPHNSFRTSHSNESKMLFVLPSLIDLAQTYATTLSNIGQPKDYADQGQTLRNRLDELNRKQEQAKLNRRVATSRRHDAIQKVYESLTHLNAAARAAYRDRPQDRDLFRGLTSRTPVTPDPKVATSSSTQPQPVQAG
ncbi:hypothetical protein [Leptolyngbya sp. FACHB-261]|uniref:hypothetical protein n=1 Tax=Leptolyngbya sp. FACHB-261 TaxID=2692806 RepID=UPI00168244A7|nr:hypothetical protein [Leptolyngbya sp. FACHB-261]MBD2104325.1 hypothetical protein [Leptolyngbya sp. FACHB-261]